MTSQPVLAAYASQQQATVCCCSMVAWRRHSVSFVMHLWCHRTFVCSPCGTRSRWWLQWRFRPFTCQCCLQYMHYIQQYNWNFKLGWSVQRDTCWLDLLPIDMQSTVPRCSMTCWGACITDRNLHAVVLLQCRMGAVLWQYATVQHDTLSVGVNMNGWCHDVYMVWTITTAAHSLLIVLLGHGAADNKHNLNCILCYVQIASALQILLGNALFNVFRQGALAHGVYIMIKLTHYTFTCPLWRALEVK